MTGPSEVTHTTLNHTHTHTHTHSTNTHMGHILNPPKKFKIYRKICLGRGSVSSGVGGEGSEIGPEMTF